MISRKNTFGLGKALSLAAVCLTVNAPVWAQDEAAPAADPSLDASLGASTDGSTDAALTTTEPAAVEPAPEPVAEPAPVEPAPPAEPVAEKKEEAAPTKADTKEATAPDNSWGIKQLQIVQTPWSAYPSAYTRGITYGSLWRTFHGQQWPYMPSTDKEKNLQIGFGGYIWNDVNNARIEVDPVLGAGDQNRWTTQTRGLLRMTPTLNVGKGWFVQGNAEFVVQGDMRPDPTSGVLATTDDVWLRFGKWDLFDITVGRFQGWEIANHYGMGLDWATLERQGAWVVGSTLPKPTDGYGLDYFWDRQNFLLGGYALHVYPFKWLRGELLAHIGSGSGNAETPYQFDLRPSAIFDIGFLKIKGGYEFGIAKPQDANKVSQDRRNGWGVAAQVVLAPWVEFGGSFARGYQDVLDSFGLADLAASNTVQGWGGFLNVSPGWEPLVLGGGFFWKSYENFYLSGSGDVDKNDQMLLYGAAQYNLWRQFYIKLVISHASNKGQNTKNGEYINNSLSSRLRLEYLF
ncbi:MAG TPA: hypothetical protein VN764_15215 [Polyangiaceae bacterium]|nr:hypothetical protein [Polyangiaceae bacterium]